jgi:putative endonuclease
VEKPTTKQKGDDAEDKALQHLQAAGLRLLERNYRTPGRGGGEVDLIMLDSTGGRPGTLVFVEVRQRKSTRYGGAAASVGTVKQRRIILAARHYLLRWLSSGKPPPSCRFDVVAIDGGELNWLQAAFDTSGF